MDFWASLEHKIQYKYQGEIPERLVHELKQASDAAAQLDRQMERLHAEVHGDEPADDVAGIDDDILHRLWDLARAD